MDQIRYSSISLERLPRFPASIIRILRHIRDPEISPDSLQNLLIPEEELCESLVKLANHPLFSSRGQVQTVSHAIVSLGREGFQNLLFVAGTLSLFRNGLHVFDATELRMHSLSCAILSQEISQQFRLTDPGTAFRSGLIHDIGLIAISMGPREALSQAFARAAEKGLPLVTMEEALLGFHHGQIGFRYGERLDLDPALLQAVRFHHEPESAPDHRALVAVVCLSDYLSRFAGLGYGISEGLESPAALDRHPAWEILRGEHPAIREVKFWELASKLMDRLREMREFALELCEEPVSV